MSRHIRNSPAPQRNADKLCALTMREEQPSIFSTYGLQQRRRSNRGKPRAWVPLALTATMIWACSGSGSEPQVIIASGAVAAPSSTGVLSAASSGAGSSTTTPSVTAPSATAPSAGGTPSLGASSGGSGGGSSANNSGSAPAGPAGSDAGAAGVPCDLATMLATNCNACHGDPPIPGALAGLVTYADLMASSQEMPSENEAQLSLSRMKNTSLPMPPGGTLPAAEVATLQNWINAGYPMGSCGTAGVSDAGQDAAVGATGPATPIAASSVFANAAPFVAGAGVSGHHNAGQDCNQGCHNHGFTIAGTLFDSAGAGIGGAEVRLVDSTGKVISVYTATGGSQGNFYSKTSFVGPAHIGVRNATGTQTMITAIQTTAQAPASTGGACNACHCSGGGCTIAAIHLP